MLACIPAIIFVERAQRRIPVNYAKLASAYGVKTWRVTTLTELHAAIEASKQSDVSTLIEIMVLSGTMTEGYENFLACWHRLCRREGIRAQGLRKAE